MRIKKVKISGDGRITINYDQKNGSSKDAWDELSLNSPDRPLNSFYTAMDNLRISVCQICELPEDYAKTMTVSGVTLTYANEVMGAVITAKKDLKNSNAPLIINTPHKTVEPYSDGADESVCLTNAQCVALDHVIKEAEKYIRGERMQGVLNFDQQSEPATAG